MAYVDNGMDAPPMSGLLVNALKCVFYYFVGAGRSSAGNDYLFLKSDASNEDIYEEWKIRTDITLVDGLIDPTLDAEGFARDFFEAFDYAILTDEDASEDEVNDRCNEMLEYVRTERDREWERLDSKERERYLQMLGLI